MELCSPTAFLRQNSLWREDSCGYTLSPNDNLLDSLRFKGASPAYMLL